MHNEFTSSRPHVAKIQRYERRRAKALAPFDGILNITTIITVAVFMYIVLIMVLA